MVKPERLSDLVREAQTDDEREARDLSRARARLLATREPDRAPRTWVWPSLAVAMAATLLLVWLVPREQPLALRIDRGAWTTELARVEAEDVARTIAFDDDSRLELAEHSQLAVTALGAHGATVRVRGRVHARITHRDDTAWRFEAGPYVVHVVGTAFSLGWQDERLSLSLDEGAVRLDGPGFAPRIVRAGESVSLPPSEAVRAPAPAVDPAAPTEVATASAARAIPIEAAPSLALSREGPRARAPEPTPAPPGAEVVEDEPDATAPAREEPDTVIEPDDAASTTTESAPTLAQVSLERAIAHAARAEHRDAMRALDDPAFAAAVRSAGAEDLLVLGDSARLSGQADRARQALASVRGRFAGTPQAARASFLLGRIAADAGDTRGALRHFERYLDEEPDGPLAREALGRDLEARVSLGLDARDTATRYLARWPSGPHAATARAALAAP
jgi:TolA-binding protein